MPRVMRVFLPFEKARAIVQKLGLNSYVEWSEWCKSGKRPTNIPRRPGTFYRNKGWLDFADWLGYSPRRRPTKKQKAVRGAQPQSNKQEEQLNIDARLRLMEQRIMLLERDNTELRQNAANFSKRRRSDLEDEDENMATKTEFNFYQAYV